MSPEELSRIATEADDAARAARSRLVTAVRAAHADGMTQAQIAWATGRSQPEISRLLRFHGTGPLARRLRKHRRPVLDLIEAAGGSNVRVFGSVATGRERPDSDIDLLFHMGLPLSLMDLARLEVDLSDTLRTDVDLVPDSALAPFMRERVLAEGVSL